MSFSLRICVSTIFIITLVIALFGLGKPTTDAADFYKYLDQNGTLVFTEDLSSIPSELRDQVEKITMPGNTSEKTPDGNSGESDKFDLNALKDLTDPEQILTLGETQLREGKAALTSFLKDEIVLLSAYAITGIILFVFLSKMLKNLGGNILKKIIFKMIFVTALFCGAYFWYLSYLNKNVLNFDLDGTGGKVVSNKPITPSEMLKKTQDIIDQVNAKTKQKQEVLDHLK